MLTLACHGLTQYIVEAAAFQSGQITKYKPVENIHTYLHLYETVLVTSALNTKLKYNLFIFDPYFSKGPSTKRLSPFTLTSVQVISSLFKTTTLQLSSPTMAAMPSMIFSSDLSVLRPRPPWPGSRGCSTTTPSCQSRWGRIPRRCIEGANSWIVKFTFIYFCISFSFKYNC